MDPSLEYSADVLCDKVKHYLLSATGKTHESADLTELYRSLCFALREEAMIHWSATKQTIAKRQARMVFYLSMEYLPGKFLGQNITSLCLWPVIDRVMQKLGRTMAEFEACDAEPGLGNGGLGRLASCLLESLVTQNYPAMGYGLRYQYGTFEQEIRNGVQVERPECWLLYNFPWELRKDSSAKTVQFNGRLGEVHPASSDCEEVRALPYDIPIIGYNKDKLFNVLTMRLWSTKESPRNFQLQRYNAGKLEQASENTSLTDVLYPSDNHELGKRIRLKQEFLLVSASVQDIVENFLHLYGDIQRLGDKVRIHINDTHPATAVAELMRLLVDIHQVPFDRAFEMTQEVMSYTNHTILAEALEEWNQPLFSQLLPRQYRMIERLNQKLCDTLRGRYPGDEPRVQRMSILQDGRVRMAPLSIWGSHSVNGVAALHTDILKKTLFRDFYEAFPDRFLSITNGVTPRLWLLNANPKLSAFITKHIGPDWKCDFSKISELATRTDPTSLSELAAIKQANKVQLAQYLKEEYKERNSWGEVVRTGIDIDPQSLFDVQVKRIHEYKRQLLNVLHIIRLYLEAKDNPAALGVKRTHIFGGKAAAGYEIAKNVIQVICCLARTINNDDSLKGRLRVVFVENYNVTKAEEILTAADLSEQISTAGYEASGTGNMKMAMNGALTIGTEDGANIEMRRTIGDAWWPFSFGATADEIQHMRLMGSYNPHDYVEASPILKRVLESFVNRTFATTDAEHEVFSRVYYTLLGDRYGERADRFFVIKDFESYCQAQKKAEGLFADPMRWSETALHNIAGMGMFSSDNAVENYAKRVWMLERCLLDEEIVNRVTEEFRLLDKCRVLIPERQKPYMF